MNRVQNDAMTLAVSGDHDHATRAYDLLTGHLLWRTDTGAAALAVGNRLVVATNDQETAAYSARTGQPVWSVPVAGKDAYTDAGGLFVRTADGRLVGLDPATGAVRFTGPVVPELADAVLVGGTETTLVSQ